MCANCAAKSGLVRRTRRFRLEPPDGWLARMAHGGELALLMASRRVRLDYYLCHPCSRKHRAFAAGLAVAIALPLTVGFAGMARASLDSLGWWVLAMIGGLVVLPALVSRAFPHMQLKHRPTHDDLWLLGGVCTELLRRYR